VTLNPSSSRWRRRHLTVQEGLLLVFPRPESKFATARVRLPQHTLVVDEEEGIFKLVRKSKVTLYMKVGESDIKTVGGQ